MFFSFYHHRAVWAKRKQTNDIQGFIISCKQTSEYDIETNERISELIKMKRRKKPGQARAVFSPVVWTRERVDEGAKKR